MTWNIQQQEDADYEMMADYDYRQEAFGDLGDSPEMIRFEMEYIAQWEDYGPFLSVSFTDEIPF